MKKLLFILILFIPFSIKAEYLEETRDINLEEMNISIYNEIDYYNLNASINYSLKINVSNDEIHNFVFKLPYFKYENIKISTEDENITYDISFEKITFNNLKKGTNIISISYDLKKIRIFDNVKLLYDSNNEYDISTIKVRFIGNNLNTYNVELNNNINPTNISDESIDFIVDSLNLNNNELYYRVYNKPSDNIVIKTKFDNYKFLPYFIILTVISLYIYYGIKFGKRIKQIYPSNNYNSLDLAYFNEIGKTLHSFNLKKNVDISSNSIKSLIIYLASRGYLKFSYTDRNNNKLKDGFLSIEKIKEYDGSDQREKELMNDLFKNNNKIFLSDLKDFNIIRDKIKFDTCEKYKDVYNKNINYYKIFHLLIYIILMVLLSIFIFNILNTDILIKIIFLIMLLIYEGFSNFMLSFTIIGVIYKSNLLGERVRNFIGLCFLLLINMEFVYIIFVQFYENTISFNEVLCFVIYSLLISVVFTNYLYSNNLKDEYSKICNNTFDFIKYINKTNEKLIIKNDSNYLENVFSYIFAMDYSDKILRKFKDTNVKKPKWIDSDDNKGINHYYDVVNFLNKISNF